MAVSINLQRIVSLRSLPGAVLGSTLLLVAVLMDSTFALVPEQPRWVPGAEVLVVDRRLVDPDRHLGPALRAPIPDQPRSSARARSRGRGRPR